MIFLLVIVGAYLLLKNSGGISAGASGQFDLGGILGSTAGSVSFSALGANSNPATWYQGITPGTVSLGGAPAPAGWSPSDPLRTGASLTGTAIGAATGIAGAVGSITGATSILAASTTLGAVTLGAGLAVGLVTTVLGMIDAHHTAALAAEGKALNDSDPRAENAMVLVLQAVLVGAISSAAQAKAQLDQIVSDWYGEVKSIQRGTWPYKLTPAQDPSILTADPTPGTQNWFGASIAGNQRPGTCNAACTVGHYVHERNRAICMIAVQNALAGQHGVMTFPAIGAHDTQTGFPEIRVVY